MNYKFKPGDIIVRKTGERSFFGTIEKVDENGYSLVWSDGIRTVTYPLDNIERLYTKITKLELALK